MVTCSAYGCGNRSGKDNVSFHKLPEDPELRALWIKAINRKNWTPTPTSKICSDHFLPSDLNKTYHSERVYLREGAIPSIFPDLPKYLQDTTHVSPLQPTTCPVALKGEARLNPFKNISETDEESSESSSFKYDSPACDIVIKVEPQDLYYPEHQETEGSLSTELGQEASYRDSTKPCLNLVKRECGSGDNSCDAADQHDNKTDLEDSKQIESTRQVKGGCNKNKRFLCPLCNYASDRKFNLEQHKKSKHNKDKVYFCSYCEYSATLLSNFNRHVRAKHTGEKPFTCPHCEFSCALKATLKMHILAKHIIEKPFTCLHCGYSTIQHSHLKKHILTKHSNEKPFSCSHCEFSCALKETLKKHIMSKHTKDKPHNCSVCEYSTIQISHLKKHILAKHAKKKHFLDPTWDAVAD